MKLPLSFHSYAPYSELPSYVCIMFPSLIFSNYISNVTVRYCTYIRWFLRKNCAGIRNKVCYLIFLRHLIRSRAVKNRIFLQKELFSLMRAQYVPSYQPMLSQERPSLQKPTFFKYLPYGRKINFGRQAWRIGHVEVKCIKKNI